MSGSRVEERRNGKVYTHVMNEHCDGRERKNKEEESDPFEITGV